MTSNIMEVIEGDFLLLGKLTLTFYMAPMVHWPDVMVTYENTNQILFSADAFGTFGANDGDFLDENLNTEKYWDEMRRYYACIVGKFGLPVQNALKKISSFPISIICSLHGPVWKKEIAKVVGLYDRWSRYEAEAGLVIAYGSMYGHTQLMAEAVAEGAIAGGVKNVVIHNVSKSDTSFILADIFKYNGLVIGSPTYTGELYPLIEKLVVAIEHRGIKNRIYSCFGSFTWVGAAVKKLTALDEKMNWELIGTPVENKQNVSDEKYQECFVLGLQMAKNILQ
jgi:flavorubredoxin